MAKGAWVQLYFGDKDEMESDHASEIDIEVAGVNKKELKKLVLKAVLDIKKRKESGK